MKAGPKENNNNYYRPIHAPQIRDEVHGTKNMHAHIAQEASDAFNSAFKHLSEYPSYATSGLHLRTSNEDIIRIILLDSQARQWQNTIHNLD